ncbi:MAG: hypothetical protein B7Y99_12535 [Caulobacterales bacterium 32-69-10]|nr:MAG: hypothetical protein B7Y99_12535 [Caulobacterales bacterium 32-69-10]
MHRSILAGFAVAIVLAGAAVAQAPPPPANVRVDGVVTAVETSGLKVRGADGKELTVGFTPDFVVVETRPVDFDAIKPGAFVATANVTEADGVGRSIELRMFEPGSRAGEGNRPMTQAGAAPGQMMTNATVSSVSRSATGRELTVTFPGGERKIVVPEGMPIIASFPTDPSVIKPGVKVFAIAAVGPDGTLRTNRLTVGEAFAPARR